MERAVPNVNTPGTGSPRRLRAPTPRAALVIAAAVILALVLLSAAAAVKPFLLGALLVYLLAPVVERLVRTGVPAFLAVLLVFVVVIGALFVVATLALTPFVQQVRLFISDMPEIVTGLRAGLERFYADLSLAPELRDAIDGVLENAAAGIGALDIGGIVAPLVTSIMAVVSTITAYAILPAWLFFLLKDRVRLADSLERSLPPAWRGDVFAVLAISNRVFGNWIRGQLLLGLVVGLASYVGLLALSVLVDPLFGRYAVLLAIIAGVLELVPFIGPIIAAVPAVLVGMIVGPQGVIAALLLYLAIQQLENNILVPKIQGDAVELHPSAVMISLVVGASLAGVLGAIASLPIAAASRDVFRYLFNRLSDPPASVDGALAIISPRLVGAVRRSAVDATERSRLALAPSSEPAPPASPPAVPPAPVTPDPARGSAAPSTSDAAPASVEDASRDDTAAPEARR